MRNNTTTLKALLAVGMALMLSGAAWAQEVVSPCPEVLIEQRYDHVASPFYQEQHWDTVIDCNTRQSGIEISAEPYIPVQYFNGYYTVEQIPYNPPDTTFALGTRMPINTDDDYAGSATNIPYPFYFFGIRKNYFRLGANGLVTFTTNFGSGTHCAWSYSAPLPWPTGTAGAPFADGEDRVRDAIYGIYEDTYPSPSIHGNTGNPNWGIYYGIQDTFPCRKIICSWNDVPQFSCTSLRCTYQIVCYEGSNIIEVHVKQRQVCTNWNNGNGLIGIQNATGQPQVPDQTMSWPLPPNFYVQNGAPAYFAPAGFNLTTQSHNYIAFRFTPQGTTAKNAIWKRVFTDGRPPVDLSMINPGDLIPPDTNGYYYPMNDNDPDHPTLTRAFVNPKSEAHYVMELRFYNANGDSIFLRDTIHIGIDTANDLSVYFANDENNDSLLNICQGDMATVQYRYPRGQFTQRETWSLQRVLNGNRIDLPLSMGIPNGNTFTLRPDPQADTLPLNHIDTILVMCYVEFSSGCQNYGEVMVCIYPNFDTTEYDGICLGDTYTWSPGDNDTTYHLTFTTNRSPENTFVPLHSQPGCDSTVRLNLTVFDISHTYDTIDDCKPIVWQDSNTYSNTNSATIETDTVVLQNKYQCDSIVHLVFTLHPLVPQLTSDLDHFDFDHLDVMLTDISIGDSARTWQFPNGPDQTGVNAYYSIPTSLDSADIRMIAFSKYGCIDSTNIVIPFNKENFWVPNIFSPDDPNGNNTFGSISRQTLKQDMSIFNRHGELVFHCEGADCEWDGRDLNGKPCPQGGYVYIIRYTNAFEPNVTKIKRGAVTLIR